MSEEMSPGFKKRLEKMIRDDIVAELDAIEEAENSDEDDDYPETDMDVIIQNDEAMRRISERLREQDKQNKPWKGKFDDLTVEFVPLDKE